VAGNKLSYLPYSLSQANLNAIWLAENQATGKIKLQPDFDEETQKEVLTCYLLPQQNFHTPSMENLLQGSINTAENTSQGVESTSAINQKPTNMESVRFAPESDNDDRPSHFVRTNTPHPKDLIKKKEALKQRASSYKEQPESALNSLPTIEAVQLPTINTPKQADESKLVENESRVAVAETNSQRILNSMNKINNRQSLTGAEPSSVVLASDHTMIATTTVSKHESDMVMDAKSTTLSFINKHVDFKLSERKALASSCGDEDEVEEEEDEEAEEEQEDTEQSNGDEDAANSSGHFRLRRRDTPHHLKGARLNSPKSQQLDPTEMKEILERYTSTTNSSSANTMVGNTSQQLVDTGAANKIKPATSFIPANLKYDELKKLVQLIIKINRQEGAGLGIRIAGGKGSNPYKEDDEGIFITRILPESPARQTGLKVGDKLVKVNQTCLNDLTHQQAADTLKEAVKSDSQLVLSVLQELDLNKLYFIQITSNEATGSSSSDVAQHGFRINYNFNTHQQREVEIISVVDHVRYGQICVGDILIQINGVNVESMSEKDLNKFVQNSSSPSAADYTIKYLTVYRPYVHQEEKKSADDTEQDTLSNSVSHQDAEAPNEHKTLADNQKKETTTKQMNGLPISSSTPLRNSKIETAPAQTTYPIEQVRLIKQNGAMGLSIVGGGNVACHPFGVDNPGIFISKIVPGGAASSTNLRVGDRILKVNNIDVTEYSHDDTVDELKRNAGEVTLLVSHDPQPKGMQEITLHRAYPEETIGIRINGGIENKSANVYDPTDEGIFVINLIQGTLAHKDGRLQVGTRIMEVNGHSLLGVKLSEAQSYLIKSSEYVHMVICDGFNAQSASDTKPASVKIEESFSNGKPINGGLNSSPFPRVPPPQPPARQSINVHQNNGTLNGNHVSNGYLGPNDNVDFGSNGLQVPNKLQILNSSNCNYDNLRSIDSDDSRLTSPDPVNSFIYNNGRTPTTNPPHALSAIQQHQTSSLPITDKNIMSNIMNKSNNVDLKSQSMMTTNTNTTPVPLKNQSDSVRSFKDKMKFFETQREESVTKPRTKFSYLQEHEIQKIKQEEEKKISSMSQDEILNLSRLEYGDDITNHKDYATFFSN